MNGRKFEAGRWMKAGIVVLGVVVLLVGALAATAAAQGGGKTATAAKKKKCKKHHKKASSAKKKKCKKKKTTPAEAPAPVVPSTLRATLSWVNHSHDLVPMDDGDLDLYVWDSNGVGGHFNPPNGDGPTPIPNTTANIDGTNGFAPETFTDLLSPSTRQFTYGVCVARIPASTVMPPPPPAAIPFTLTVRLADGTTVVKTQTSAPEFSGQNWKDKGDHGLYVPPGGFTPPDTWCAP